MRLLFEMDKKDYKENGTVGIRPSVRGIIVKDKKIAMIYSKKYNYYKFPGGGALAGDNIKLLKKYTNRFIYDIMCL